MTALPLDVSATGKVWGLTDSGVKRRGDRPYVTTSHRSAAALSYPAIVSTPARSEPAHYAALREQSAYPHAVDRVDVIETHISWVALAGGFVYKLRKPVDFGFLDFSTLARRRRDCENEVRLNRRLAPDVYLGVVPITKRGDAYTVGGRGRAIDYAVKMRRLPAGAFLDAKIAAGEANARHVERIAERLVAFHAGAAGDVSLARYGAPRYVRANWDEHLDQWAPWVGTLIRAEEDAEVRRFVATTLRRYAGVLRARIADGRVREGHGDLRAAQIAFEDGQPLILDCVEFSRRLRCIDTGYDIAFLAMDLDARGQHELAQRFLGRYLELADDPGAYLLMPSWLAQRAAIRAKVDLLRSAQLDGDARRTAEARGRAHFDRLLGYIRQRRAPALVVMSGLSGTGKSTLAREVGARLGAPIVASDVIRKRMAGVAPTERAPTGAYTHARTRAVYRALYRRARERLGAGRDVILDATFLLASMRDEARTLADEAGAKFVLVETVLPGPDVRRRLDARAAAGGSVSDATWAIYQQQRREFEAIEEPHVVVDMRRPVGHGVAAVLWGVFGDG